MPLDTSRQTMSSKVVIGYFAYLERAHAWLLNAYLRLWWSCSSHLPAMLLWT